MIGRRAFLGMAAAALGSAFAVGAAGSAAAQSGPATMSDGSQPAGALIIYADTVLSAEGLTPAERPLLACVQMSRFKQGQKIVFRARVIDPATGQALTSDTAQSVIVVLPNGDQLPMVFEGHPPMANLDYYWTAVFAVPDDYPTGEFGYTIEATAKNGRSGSLQPFNIGRTTVQIIAKGN
jgi:hypothetical protein